MKLLQNNYTSPEQSKRLLELGVPADSADMLYFAIENSKENYDRGIFYETPAVLRGNNIFHEPTTNTFPCWSVGRLIEITTICREWFDDQKYHSYIFQKDISPIEKVIYKIEIAARMNQIDFSKLED